MTDLTAAHMAAVISTLSEFSDPVPASSIYLALGCDMAAYKRLTACLVRAGWLEDTGSTLCLTRTGRAKAIEVNAILKTKES